MKRLLSLLVIAVLGAGLTGCKSVPQPPDPDAVSEWIQEQSASDRPGLATMAGAPRNASGPTTEGEESITVDFASATSVTGVEFSCFGEESMSVAFELRGAAETRSTGSDDLVCADSPHLLPEALDGVIGVSVSGTSEHGSGAWSVVVLGEEQ
ncbi:hypothetical protein [Microbacterium sp. NPDC056234]|uniref:hypothetical protein n=1 Tax=Microbacterium sp. NPDC056234 TaxID=3345757 RepID=UPI0035D68FBE